MPLSTHGLVLVAGWDLDSPGWLALSLSCSNLQLDN
jgi:uncharacterized membrane protein